MKVEHVGGCNEGCRGDDHLLISETPAGGHAPDGHFAVSPVGSEREVAAVPPAGHRRAELIDVRARWIEGRVQRRIERSSLRPADVDLDAWSEQAEREWVRAHPALEAWLAEGGGDGE